MSYMALDNLALSIITDALNEQLSGSVFGKPLALSATDFGFPYNAEVGNDIRHGTFLFSVDATNPFVAYSFDRYEKVEDNSPFFNSLKRLSLAQVNKVSKLPGERVITISFNANRNDLSEVNSGYDLILELFPNHPNVYIVAYPYGRIVSLYRERTNIEKGILVTRNAIYSYPAPRESLPDSVTDLTEAKSYLSNACYRALEKEVVEQKIPFSVAMQELRSSSSLYQIGKEILPYHFHSPEAKPLAVSDIYSFLVEDQKKLAKLQKEKELIGLLQKAIKVSEKKSQNLEKDLATAKAHADYLIFGQEIYLYQNEIRKGDRVLNKDGYSIPLDPLLTAPNNANRYFKKYTKSKAAIKVLSELQVTTAQETDYLKKKLQEVKDGTPRDILELKSELVQEKVIKEKQAKRSIPKVSTRRSYEPHYLILPQGKIGFGMNGLQNETLTFKVAQKDDVFLHVKDYSGAHVVIMEGKENPEVLHTAEELALFLSHLDAGEVMIAKRKDVRKNPLHIGLVNVLKYQTVMVKFLRSESLALFQKTLKG